MDVVADHPPLQPALHDLVTVVRAPVTALGATSGQIEAVGAGGVFAADLRVLSLAVLTVDGLLPEPVSHTLVGADTAEFVAVLRRLGDPVPDPTVWVRRRRTALAHGLAERIEIENVSTGPLRLALELRFAADLAAVETVKTGRSDGLPEVPFTAVTSGAVTASSGEVVITVTGDGDVDPGTLRWELEIPSRSRGVAQWQLAVEDPGAVIGPAADVVAAPRVAADDRRLTRVVDRSVADLSALAAVLADRPDDVLFTAGSPWYLTLFGRDSIWSARMSLPLGLSAARGTLRALAALQGTRTDPVTAEQPGKILHEVRRAAFSTPDGAFLPPVYYGTVDATPLWVCLLRDAWRWGLPVDEVAALLDTAQGALDWMRHHGDADGDGFLEYIDTAGGLTNQGWKDSGDSVRFRDGTIAQGPVALAEVQGYAYEAALAGAELFEAFDRPGAAELRDWAAALRTRFRESFWADDDLGRYPILALDGRKQRVDAVASNMGHLLGTGLLDADEAAAVAARVTHPSMDSGFGLRTMATTAGGYSPLSYHCGSVWPHDTAIVLLGLVREGFVAEAGRLAAGLLAAADAFDGRLPELFAGFAADDTGRPVPYPASCRPQAWAAGAAVVLLQAFLGLDVDVPGGTVTLSPSTAIGGFGVRGLQIAGQDWDVAVTADGSVTADAPPGLELRLR